MDYDLITFLVFQVVQSTNGVTIILIFDPAASYGHASNDPWATPTSIRLARPLVFIVSCRYHLGL